MSNFFAGYTITDFLRDLISLATLGGLIFVLVKNIWFAPKEAKKSDLDNAASEVDIKMGIIKTLEDSTDKAITRAINFEERISKQDAKIETLSNKVDFLECEIANKDAVIASLTDWAERLVHQIQSIGGIDPVKMKPPKIVKCEEKV